MVQAVSPVRQAKFETSSNFIKFIIALSSRCYADEADFISLLCRRVAAEWAKYGFTS
jgi:hypothetical protein